MYVASTVDMSKTNQYQPQVKGKPPKGDSLDAYWQDPNCPKGKLYWDVDIKKVAHSYTFDRSWWYVWYLAIW